MCVKNQIIHSITDMLIYNKSIRDFCVRKTRKNMRDPQNIQVIGQLSKIILGRSLDPKYGYPSTHVVQVQIWNKYYSNRFINFILVINLMEN